MSTTLVGTLLEIHDGFIVLTGPTYIMVPPGDRRARPLALQHGGELMKVENLVIGEALSVTATSQGGRWTAQRIERAPV